MVGYRKRRSVVQMIGKEATPNETGLMSEGQRATLREHRLWYLAGSAAFVVLLLGLIVAVAIKVNDPAFAGRGPFWIVGALVIVWLVLLSRACLQYLRVRR